MSLRNTAFADIFTGFSIALQRCAARHVQASEIVTRLYQVSTGKTQ